MNGLSEECGQPHFIHNGDRAAIDVSEAVVPELAGCYKVAALNAFNKLSM